MQLSLDDSSCCRYGDRGVHYRQIQPTVALTASAPPPLQPLILSVTPAGVALAAGKGSLTPAPAAWIPLEEGAAGVQNLCANVIDEGGGKNWCRYRTEGRPAWELVGRVGLARTVGAGVEPGAT